MDSQAVGAYGEKAVEAELLRRGWLPANVNASVKNAEAFDIFARKTGQFVGLRVKTCGVGWQAFQFNFPRDREIKTTVEATDFTILVSMGDTRARDEFYILPTREVRAAIAAHRSHYLATLKRDGSRRKDTGQWTIYLKNLASGLERPSHGYAETWRSYLDRWDILDGTFASEADR